MARVPQEAREVTRADLAPKAPPPARSEPISGNSSLSGVLNKVPRKGLDVSDPAVGRTECDERRHLEVICDVEGYMAWQLADRVIKRLEARPRFCLITINDA